MGQKQAKLRQEILDDLVRQTAFSESEIQDWYKGFLKDCPTGHLTVDEFKHTYAKFFPYGEASRFAEYVFRTFDSNRDGVVDFREFLSIVSVTSRGDLDQKLRWAFKMYDLDGDGFISRQDMQDVLSSVYALVGSTVKMPEDESTPERRANKIFRQMDANHDDRLSFDEFAQGIRSDQTILRVLTAPPLGCDSRPTGEPADGNLADQQLSSSQSANLNDPNVNSSPGLFRKTINGPSAT